MKRLLPLFFMMLACLGCSPPPFDLSLSQSAGTIKKLTPDNTSLITASLDSVLDEQDYVFFPQVLATGFDYSAGFVTSMSGQSIQIRAVSLDPGSAQLTRYDQTGSGLADPDAHAPGYTAWPTKGGSSYLFGTVYDAVNPDTSAYVLLFGDTSAKRTIPLDSGGLSMKVGASISGVSVLGSSVFALPAVGADALHVLARQSSGTDFVEATYLLGSGTVSFSIAQRGYAPWSLSFLPSYLTRVMYYYDENPLADSARFPNRSYASWYDTSTGSWKCATWWGTASSDWKSLPAVTARIDALLSNGDLLSTEGGTGRVYDRDGVLLATFPMGSLVYLGEEYVNGAARAYFEQCFISDSLLHFNVYGTSTDTIATLGN